MNNECCNCINNEFCNDEDKEHGMYYFNYSCFEEYKGELEE